MVNAFLSSCLLREGVGAAGTLPTDANDLEGLFKVNYDGSRFWQALARAPDPTGRVHVPQDWNEVLNLRLQ